MTNNDKENFWDLSEYAKKPRDIKYTQNTFSPKRISAIEITDNLPEIERDKDASETLITRFVPPHSDSTFEKKHVLFSYEPENPLIKSVTVFSDKEDTSLFVEDNLFLRERRAFLNRPAVEKEYVPFYSYSPRYSQLNKSQLAWYIWWRDNLRRGNYIKTDESYVLLYAYELAATDDNEDKDKALNMLCSLLTRFSTNDLRIVYKIMIRDIICDFCLIHSLRIPIRKLAGVERQIILGSFLPELLLDLSAQREESAPLIAAMSLYDYRRSKCYNEENAKIFKRGIEGAVGAVLSNNEAFESITSFTRGVYSAVTQERHPFSRMANIVNKNIKIEIVYYELSTIKTAITDIVRYSENKVREHLGIRSMIHVLTVNPYARDVINAFFEENMPARKFVDRRKKENRAPTVEVNEYDKLYDVPKVEISPERALQIELESWDTTKKLTEAFGESDTDSTVSVEQSASDNIISEASIPDPVQSTDDESVYSQLSSRLGAIASFINLCKGSSIIDQRRFASSRGMSCDEIADKINETAVEALGDIILENDGEKYVIIEDYLFLFN